MSKMKKKTSYRLLQKSLVTKLDLKTLQFQVNTPHHTHNCLYLAHVSDFTKMTPDEVNILGDYDYTSVMHYSPTTFAKDKANPEGRSFTVNRTWNNQFPEIKENMIGQRNDLSSLDIQKIRKLYRCGERFF